MSYPDIEDSDFYNKLYGKKEYNEDTEKIPGIKQEPYQQFVRKFMNKNTPYNSLLLFWSVGLGKCLSKDTPIIMYDGTTKKVQDVEIGDLVMGDDSTPRKVLNLSRGTGPLFDVIPVKGDKYTVNSEHILSLKYSTSKTLTPYFKHGKYIYHRVLWCEKGKVKKKMFPSDKLEEAQKFFEEVNHDPYMDIPVKEYLLLNKDVKANLKGYRKGIDFPEKPIPMDPYMIGYWLGDGNSRNSEIISQDSTILYYFNEKYRYKIKSYKGEKNTFTDALKDLNLIQNKHIPDIYKYNSREIRLKLLAGLLDSDGHLSSNCFEFTQKNETLMDDVIYLCRSLGFSCYKSVKKTSWTWEGEKKEGEAFRISINGAGIEEIPTIIPRKQAKKRTQKKDVLLTGIKVEPVGVDDYYGFELDGNHRFLLGDFTVTHNSLGSISIAENFKEFINQIDGLEKILIITKSKTLQGVYKKELAKFFYATESEKTGLIKRNKDVIKRVNQKINNYYEFINYDELTNRVIGQVKKSEFTEKKTRNIKEEKVISDFDNRIVIIDEVQNITGNYRYLSIFRLLRNSKNVRLVLLSATPMTNSVDEIIYISNLLNWKNPVFDIDESTLDLTEHSNVQLKKVFKELYKENILEIKKINIANENNQKEENEKTINFFTQKGENLLINSLKGKISYHPFDPVNFPKKIRIGIPITNKPGSYKVFHCPMSSYQENIYLYAKETNKSYFYGNLIETCMIAYDSPDIEGALDIKNIKKTSLKKENIYKYSSKLHFLLQNIEKSEGICFIYSNYVKNGGTELIENFLEANGYTEFSEDSKTTKNYIRYSDKMTEKDKVHYEYIINSVDNIYGEKIKIIIGSPLVSEGLSFFNVRQVHIMEPYWNLTRTLQAEGRCIRNGSHNLLPENQRNVSIFWYVSTLSTGDETIDQIKYLVSEEKDREIKALERKLKMISIDCYNTKKIIDTKKKKNKEKYEEYYKNFSPECDYQDCNYQCLFVDEDKIKEYKKQDKLLTYNENTDPYQIKLAKTLIKKLFEYNEVYTLPLIESNLKETGLNIHNIYWALESLVSKMETFIVKNKGFGYIIHSKKYYKFITKENSKKIKDKNLDLFLKEYLPEEKNNVVETPVIIPIKKPEVHENPVIHKVYSISEFSEQKNSKLLGSIEGEKFKIVDLRKNKSQGTNRDFSRGKMCSSFKKEELIEILGHFNIVIPRTSKEDYCKAIFEEMKKKDLIIYLD